MKNLIPFLLFLGFSYVGNAQVTYASDIAEIIYTKCATCHRPGEIGPMSLTNYNEVQSWGTMIQYVTTNKIMPPWQADPDYSHFLEENFLSEEEINKLSEWVDKGMERGEVSEEPDFPDFPEGSLLGVPDLVIEMEEEWLHEGNNLDNYRYFVLPTNFAEDKIIKNIEFRAGNGKIVHHALIFEDTTGVAAANDALTPEYGFNGFGSYTGGDITETLDQKQFPSYVPGQKPIRYPDGVGQILHAGADIVLQVHYAPWPVDEVDQSKINIFFMDESEEVLERRVESHIMIPLPEVINELFFIFPNVEKTFHGQYEITKDVSLITIAPHMHLLGKNWKVWLEQPNGEIVNLIKIPDWDFNWQGAFYFDRYIKAPAGSIVHAEATYDNTVNNPNNPNNPPQLVQWGEYTTEEMYYLPIGFVDYREGDEDIIFNQVPVGVAELEKEVSQIYPMRPNPVSDFTIAGFRLEKGQALNIAIYNIGGQKIRTLRAFEFYNMGEHFINFSTRNLPAGIYFLQLRGKNLLLNQKFVKQ